MVDEVDSIEGSVAGVAHLRPRGAAVGRPRDEAVGAARPAVERVAEREIVQRGVVAHRARDPRRAAVRRHPHEAVVPRDEALLLVDELDRPEVVLAQRANGPHAPAVVRRQIGAVAPDHVALQLVGEVDGREADVDRGA